MIPGGQVKAGSQRRPDPMRIILSLLIIVGISRIHQHFGFIAALHPGLLLFVAVIGWTILVPSSVDWRLLRASWLPKGLLAIVLIACLGAPFGLSFGAAAAHILNVYSRVLVPAIVFMIAIRTAYELRVLVWAYLIGISVLLWVTIFLMDLRPSSGGLARVGTAFMYDGNDMGVLLMLALPMALTTLETSGTKLGRWWSVLSLWGIGSTVARTGSRGAMVGLVTVALGLMVVVRHVSVAKKAVAVAVLALALAVAAPPGYWTQMQTIVNPEDDYNLTDPYGRKALAIRGLGYMAQYPVFGVGISNFSRAETTISPLLDQYAVGAIAIRTLVAHNTYIQVGSELGIPALLIWLGFLWTGVFGLQKLKRRVPSWWKKADPDRRFLHAMLTYLPISFLGFATTSFFVSHPYLPHFYIFLGYLASMFHLVPRLLAEDAGGSRPPSPRRQRIGARRWKGGVA